MYDNTSTILNRHGYTLNDANQRTTITRTNYAASSYNGKVDYTYDNAGEARMARAYNSAGTPVAAENFEFGYDAGWNMLKRTNNAAVTSYTINNLNQITADGGASWGHDNNGNLTFRPRSGGYDLSYTYDDENQLLSVSSANLWKIEFTYDGRGRMRLRRDYTWSGSSWAFSTEVRYVYDGMLIVQERSSGNHPQVTYTRGTDLSGTSEGAGGIGGLLSRGAHAISSPYQLSSAAHYHADGNGNVTMLVGTGAPTIKAYYKYDPFGRTLGSSGSLVGVNAMRFSSKPVMGSSELYYYGYRFYDPSSQRWLSRDPLGEAADRNIYAFVRNGPANNRDSYGLLTEEQIQQIIQNFTLYGGVAGGIIGGAGGGTGGALVGLPSGPGAIATGAAGAAIGAAEGAVIGSAAGAAIGASTALTVHAIQKFFEGEKNKGTGH